MILYLWPFDDSLTNSWSVSGTIFWINSCWSSFSPYGPKHHSKIRINSPKTTSSSCESVIKSFSRTHKHAHTHTHTHTHGYTYVISCMIVHMGFNVLYGSNLEWRNRHRARLSAYHSTKTGHTPWPHMVIFGTHCKHNKLNNINGIIPSRETHQLNMLPKSSSMFGVL